MLSIEAKIESLLNGSEVIYYFFYSYQIQNITPIVPDSICSPASVGRNKVIPSRKRNCHSFIDVSELYPYPVPTLRIWCTRFITNKEELSHIPWHWWHYD